MHTLFNNRGKLPILLIIAAVVVLALAGTGVMLFLGKGKSGAKKAEKHEEPEVMMKLDEFIVNLADTDESRYLKLECTLGVIPSKEGAGSHGGGGGHGGEGGDPMLPVIRDVIITTCGKHTYKELLTPEGKEQLKKELAEALEKSPAKLKVKSVYFVNFAMQ